MITKILISTITVLILFTNCTSNHMITRKYNPGLPVLKPGWEGNISINGRFYNDTLASTPSFWSAFQWKLTRNPQRKEKKEDKYELPVHRFQNLSDANGITWLGHSTFIIQTGGINIITDPVFYNIPSVKRKTELPCNPDSITNLDYMLLSHDHFDHFDKKSIELLIRNNPQVNILAPLNARRLFKKRYLENLNLQEAGWYQEYKTDNNIRIIFLPARHWGRRGLTDTNKTLWGSFLILSDEMNVFFAGDSAYDDQIYKDIHNLFGDMDICIFPIGAYAPEWFMSPSHMNPEQAVKAFHQLKGKWFLPMHYGTFDLSDEPMSEPVRRLKSCFMDNDTLNGKLQELTIGLKWPAE